MRRKLLGLVAFVVLGAVAACGSSSQPSGSGATTTTSSAQFSQQLQQQLQQTLSTAQQTYRIPGMVAAVSVPGQGTWVQAVGVASTSTNQTLSPNYTFKIGSVTKTFTATVILQLVQQGKLSLTAPISQWVPNVQNSNSITVQMLLNMTSGIFDEGGPGSQLVTQEASNPSAVVTPQQIVSLAVAHGPAQPPGQFYYSDTNYIILGIIAQDVTGQPIQSLINSQILQPLHLSSTSFPTTPSLPSPATTGYIVQGAQTAAVPPIDPSYLGAAGAMVSTVGDMETWAKALATGSLLSPSIQQQRLQLVPTQITYAPLQGSTVTASLPLQYGLGIGNAGGLLGHNGIVPGWTADVWYFPARNATVVVLANAENTNLLASAGETVTDATAVTMAQMVLPGALTTTPTPGPSRQPIH